MTLDDEDAIKKALDVSSLEDLNDPELRELARRFDEVSPELQLQLLRSNPMLRQHMLEAVTAVEENLRAATDAMNANTREAFEALKDVRSIIAGELNKANLTDERWLLLMQMLTVNEDKATAVNTQANQLIAEQANADRLTKLAVAAMPYVAVVLREGIRLLIYKGRI